MLDSILSASLPQGYTVNSQTLYQMRDLKQPHGILLIADEIYHHVGFVIAHGDGDVALVNDAERHGGVWSPRPDFLDIGYAEDDEHPSIVILVTRPLISIADVGEEIVGNLVFALQILAVLVGGTCHLYPTIWLPLIEQCQAFTIVPVCLHLLILHVISVVKKIHGERLTNPCRLTPTKSNFPPDSRPYVDLKLVYGGKGSKKKHIREKTPKNNLLKFRIRSTIGRFFQELKGRLKIEN